MRKIKIGLPKKLQNPRNLRLFLFRIFIGIIIFSLLGCIIALIFPRKEKPNSILGENQTGIVKTKYWDSKNGTVADDVVYLDGANYKSAFLGEYKSIGVTPSIAKISQNGWNLLLLNKNYILPDNYELDLDKITGSDIRLESGVVDYFNSMYIDASKKGLTLTPYSGYRSFTSQRRLFENAVYYLEVEANSAYANGGSYDAEGNYVEPVMKSSEQIGKDALLSVSLPGCSDHNAGLAIDICSQSDDFADTEEYKWLTENAYKYGFVLRYPKGKEKITGMNFQPYCWRFVGKNAAKEMKQNNLCLEEYIKM